MATHEQAVRYEALDTVQIGRKTIQKSATVLLRPSTAADLVKEKKVKPAKLAPHKVLGNLRHDGSGYAPGAIVNLHASDAAALIAAKVVEPVKAAKSDAEPEPDTK